MTDHLVSNHASTHQDTPIGKPNFIDMVRKGLPMLLVLAVMGGGWMVMHHINSGGHTTEDVVEASEPSVPIGTLVLPKGKLEAAKLESVPAQHQLLQHVRTVPGRLRYDQSMHVDVKAPMDGILAEIVVTQGDRIAAGDLIAVLRSPEVGQARAEILKQQAELDIAQQLLNREQTLAKNIEQVAAMLDQNLAVDAIESAFSDRALGAYRQEILSACAKVKLADELIAKVSTWHTSCLSSGISRNASLQSYSKIPLQRRVKHESKPQAS